MSDEEFIGRVPPSEKTNWKDEIRRALVYPKYCSHNPILFMSAVDSAKEIVANSYPGWNAFKEINEEVNKIKAEFKKKYDDWRKDSPNVRKSKKYLVEMSLNVEMNKKIWTFLKNYVAIHGMLTSGPHDSRPVKYEDD